MTPLNPGDRARIRKVLLGDEQHFGLVGTVMELDPLGRPVIRHEGHSVNGCIVEGAELEVSFKAGDRVRILECAYGYPGHVGEVGDLKDFNGLYGVKLEVGDCGALKVEMAEASEILQSKDMSAPPEDLGGGAEVDGRHLGDGVMATFDGYHLVLTADGTKTIYLDPSVYAALVRFAKVKGFTTN